MRRSLFWLHSWMGLVAGLGLLVIGVTGSVIVFYDELNGLLYPAVVRQPDATKPALGLDDFLMRLQKSVPEGYVVRGLELSPPPGRCCQVYVSKYFSSEDQIVYANPATGLPTAAPDEWDALLTNWLVEFHYTFSGGRVGEGIAGIFAVLLCLLGVSGVWLYRGFWKTLLQLRWGRSARIFFSDLHKMVGITSCVFNLILGITGAWWNLRSVFGPVEEGDEKPQAVTGPQHGPGVSFEAMVAEVRKTLPDFVPTWVNFADSPQGEISFYGRLESQSFLRSVSSCSATFEAGSGKVKSVEGIREAGTWDQIEDSFTPLHFGNFGGLPIKILWCLGGLAPGVLALSGSLLWWKRMRFRRRNSSASRVRSP